MEDLKLDRVFMIYPGETSYPLGENVEAVAFKDLKETCESLV